MMHPTPTELRQFANSGAETRIEQVGISHHLEVCAACREYVELIEEWNNNLQVTVAQSLESVAVADRVYSDASIASQQRRTTIIELAPMEFTFDPMPVRLAADGQSSNHPVQGLEHAATLYAVDPELVLRIMRDRQTGEESLHLIGPDPEFTANVLIHIVEPSLDFVTDNQGVARLGTQHLKKPESLQWQVRLPEAVFGLSPLQYNPEQPGAKREFELETDANNRIRVSLENRTEGIMLQLTILRIGGNDQMQHARLVITQGESPTRTVEAHGPATCTVTGLSASEPIGIRVFAE